jgi:RNA binding exosome subunit
MTRDSLAKELAEIAESMRLIHEIKNKTNESECEAKLKPLRDRAVELHYRSLKGFFDDKMTLLEANILRRRAMDTFARHHHEKQLADQEMNLANSIVRSRNSAAT